VGRRAAVRSCADRSGDEAQPAADAPGSAMSVSEMRRTRRGTGLSLDEVSKRSRIPVSLLRQLGGVTCATGRKGSTAGRSS
jgi:hypothetical protein